MGNTLLVVTCCFSRTSNQNTTDLCFLTWPVYCSVGYILNVTREIDNFFPEAFTYMNIRVYDVEATDLLPHWTDTYQFINTAR